MKQPVEVVWLDSREFANGWTFLDGLEFPVEELIISSVGILYHRDDDVIVLVQNLGSDQLKGGIVIPVCSIVSITELL